MEQINKKPKQSLHDQQVHFYHMQTNETNNDIIVGEGEAIQVTENPTSSCMESDSKEQRDYNQNPKSTFKTKHKSLHIERESNTGSAIFSNTEVDSKPIDNTKQAPSVFEQPSLPHLAEMGTNLDSFHKRSDISKKSINNTKRKLIRAQDQYN